MKKRILLLLLLGGLSRSASANDFIALYDKVLVPVCMRCHYQEHRNYLVVYKGDPAKTAERILSQGLLSPFQKSSGSLYTRLSGDTWWAVMPPGGFSRDAKVDRVQRAEALELINAWIEQGAPIPGR